MYLEIRVQLHTLTAAAYIADLVEAEALLLILLPISMVFNKHDHGFTIAATF